jgi:quinoprotein glucose dehydrogenase
MNSTVEKSFFTFLVCILFISCARKEEDYSKWTNYGGTKDGAHYSSLKHINLENIDQLEIAWKYECGDGTETS